MSRLGSKIINFRNAVERLKEAVSEYREPCSSNVIRDGMIQRFEFTYELAWKTTKAYLENIGIVEVNSPKAVIREAYAQKLLADEDNWLLMLNDRNMTTHVYKEEIAKEIAERIANQYIYEFQSLLERIQE